MFDELKYKWEMGWITMATLRKWVLVNDKKPGAGITREEYQQITGEEYPA